MIGGIIKMNDLGRTEVGENIAHRIKSCPWFNNKPESLSQILLHLYAYCGMRIADRCMVGNGIVTYH